MAEQTTVESSEDQQEKAGKYLTFVLAEEEYGLEILKVREIIGLMGITAVPRTPEHVKGVINLRGKVIPVIDLRLKFGMQEIEHTTETCIIVVSVNESEIGVLVDRVSEVLDIEAGQIEEAPSFGSEVNTEFVTLQRSAIRGPKNN
ncbi:MAG: chemotaxis protein CheW [bacterium]